MGLQIGIEERRLDHGLTIVERAFHFEGRDVRASRGELLLLDLADSALGIQDDHIDVGHVEETLGDGAARVATCRHQNGQARVADAPQHPRQESRPNVLERMGRPMEELQGVHPLFNLMEVQREIQDLFQHTVQRLVVHISFGQRRHHCSPDVPRFQIVL